MREKLEEIFEVNEDFNAMVEDFQWYCGYSEGAARYAAANVVLEEDRD